jgi:hypothetical protein
MTTPRSAPVAEVTWFEFSKKKMAEQLWSSVMHVVTQKRKRYMTIQSQPSTPTDEPSVEEEKPDYVLAKEELHEFCKTLKLTFTISEPKAKIEGYDAKKGVTYDAYPNIMITYIVDFTRVDNLRSEHFDYSMGIAHIDWAKITDRKPASLWKYNLTRDEEGMLGVIIRKGAHSYPRFTDVPAYANLCVKLAAGQKLKPDPWEVLACCARDGTDALFDNGSFEEWASNYGYDPDSRSAERTFNQTREIGLKVLRLVDKKDMEQLREYHCRF